ncbi:MAG: RNA polymerase sigma factor [Phycisphaerales bacterium]|jgi:RNA polymerase sigma-70 factor (ECF subfamily)
MLEDKLLLWKFKRGNKDAFQLIYEKYFDDLLNLAANLLNDKAQAEDVVQDVFISFVQSVDKFHLRGSLKGFLATCVANRARDYLRRGKRRKAVALDDAEQTASDIKSPVQLVINNEELQEVNQAITELAYEQREAIMLRLHGQMRFREIAQLQNVSVKTALSRYRYGLDKLRSTLNGEVCK